MKVLQIGCGGLGALIARQTLAQAHELTIVRRSEQAVPVGAQVVHLDVVAGNDISRLAALQPEILLYCLAPVAGQSYQQTYVQGLNNVLQHVSHAALRHVFFISSTSVYGEQQGEWIDDQSPAVPAGASGQHLLEAERLLEALPCGHTALRVSGIYGPQRLSVLRMVQEAARWPTQAHWTNRIHEVDVARAVVHLYQQVANHVELPSHCLVTDGVPALQHEVLQWLAVHRQLPLPDTPPLQPQSGKRIIGQYLTQTGFRPQFADYRAGYQVILATMK
ncbi:Nucleoside-diphosphate-sugar epimerase [Methylophilus rhizosphaerae]|uniref:Nucleoside-diphosphate-sugar epimerase n=1 Tax=Methylophilus rhizosphaerae TaxID=492660 RepID=A0A1G8ZUR9_9PROT|nr:NAD-dependent epimerase/dehydratase family protein [Methylophilus rhizosphaerae]SDK18374.1 Nucleoside-diphosphate-sugar epimerase [Methylophilus rhizosphaerae]